MVLNGLLKEKRAVLVERWREALFESYPLETRQFFRKEKDRFQNPVAHRLSRGIEGLYGALLQETEEEELKGYLDEIIRVKAVQDFSPSQALAFIFLLKGLIREELAAELCDEELGRQCLEFESHIDGLALLGFEVYMQCREKLSEIRIDEVKRRVSGLLRKAGLGMELE